jgi:hypothetical protein
MGHIPYKFITKTAILLTSMLSSILFNYFVEKRSRLMSVSIIYGICLFLCVLLPSDGLVSESIATRRFTCVRIVWMSSAEPFNCSSVHKASTKHEPLVVLR